MILAATIIGATMIGSGIFLLVQRENGARAFATVGDCTVIGRGRYRHTHCTGSWVVGGPLTAGGHVVVGTISGADERDLGKTIDVTLRGDTAYTRAIAVPLLLIGLGLIPGAVGALVLVRMMLRPSLFR